MIKYDIAIKLGTKYSEVYKSGVGVVYREPTILYIDNKKHSKVLGVGYASVDDAEEVYPIVDGEIIGLDVCAKYVKGVLDRLEEVRPNIVMIVPSNCDSDTRLNYEKVAYLANANCVASVYSAVCDLAGMDINPIDSDKYVMLDISDNAVCAVVSGGHVEDAVSIPYADALISDEIQSFAKLNKNMIITEAEIDKIKKTHLTILPGIDITTRIKGENVDTRECEESNLKSSEILDIVIAVFNKMVESLNVFLAKQPLDIVESIKNKGIYVTGRLCNLLGLEKYLSTKLKINVHVAYSVNTSIDGVGLILKAPKMLEVVS